MAKKPETPAQKQSRARIMCEKDNLSQPEIAERVGVSMRTIANWSERGLPVPIRGPWVKGSLARKVHEKLESSILATAERLGMDAEYFLTKVKSMCDSKKVGVQDIGLTHAERIIPGLKAKENVAHSFPEEMLAFFQESP